jgi:hypothetical protein
MLAERGQRLGPQFRTQSGFAKKVAGRTFQEDEGQHRDTGQEKETV